MNLPFTTEQFLAVFERYNLTIWPLQILLYLLAVAALLLARFKTETGDRSISAILGFLWIWIGGAYHFAFFASINPAAKIFGALAILQGILFLRVGLFKKRIAFRYRNDAAGIAGSLFILYALIVYPVLGHLSGHAYPKSPTFGLPCPTTIFTFGILLWTNPRVPKLLLIIPALWALIGSSAALTLGIREDVGLLIAGVCGTFLLILRDRKSTPPQSAEPGAG